jgi:hypothetical protein
MPKILYKPHYTQLASYFNVEYRIRTPIGKSCIWDRGLELEKFDSKPLKLVKYGIKQCLVEE